MEKLKTSGAVTLPKIIKAAHAEIIVSFSRIQIQSF